MGKALFSKAGKGPICLTGPRAGKLVGRPSYLRKQCFQEWSSWESRENMGGSGPACPFGAVQVEERTWGMAVFLLCSVSTTLTSQCSGHWSIILGPHFWRKDH